MEGRFFLSWCNWPLLRYFWVIKKWLKQHIHTFFSANQIGWVLCFQSLSHITVSIWHGFEKQKIWTSRKSLVKSNLLNWRHFFSCKNPQHILGLQMGKWLMLQVQVSHAALGDFARSTGRRELNLQVWCHEFDTYISNERLAVGWWQWGNFFFPSSFFFYLYRIIWMHLHIVRNIFLDNKTPWTWT